MDTQSPFAISVRQSVWEFLSVFDLSVISHFEIRKKMEAKFETSLSTAPWIAFLSAIITEYQLDDHTVGGIDGFDHHEHVRLN